jgi:hypothetical protein
LGLGRLARLASGGALALLFADAEKLSLRRLSHKRCNCDYRRNEAGCFQLPLPFLAGLIVYACPATRSIAIARRSVSKPEPPHAARQ